MSHYHLIVTTDVLVPGTMRPRTTVVVRTTGRDGYHVAHSTAHEAMRNGTAGAKCIVHAIDNGRRVPIAVLTKAPSGASPHYGGSQRLDNFYTYIATKNHDVQEDTTMSNTTDKNTTPVARIIVWGTKPNGGKGGVRILTKKDYEKPGSARNAAAKQSQKDGVHYVELKIDGVGEYRYEKGAVVRKDEVGTPAPAAAPKAAAATKTATTKKAPATKPAAAPAPKPTATKAAKVTSWAQVIDLTDGALAKAYKDGRKELTIDADAVLKAAKSKDATQRYDLAYLRFLSGKAGSFPSNPTSTGIAAGADRTARRDAIRKAVAKVAVTTAKVAA